MNKFLMLLIAFCFFCTSYSEASENWYVVNNYAGTIGKYPVHLSIQPYNFSDEVNVEGSYYYDHYNSPIVLFGIEKEGNIILCEASEKNDFEKYILQGDEYEIERCPFRMKIQGRNITGEWNNKNVKMDVSLSRVASLNKNIITSKNGEIDVPFWGDTKNHIFIGVYKQDKDRVAINKVKVISKDNGQVVQVINPQDKNCDFGFYMTSIYQNLERFDDSSISLNCYRTKSDFSIEYRLKGNSYIKVE